MADRQLTETSGWQSLQEHAAQMGVQHLRQLLSDADRCQQMRRSAEGIVLDFARQLATPHTLELLLQLAEETDVKGQIAALRRGDKINVTEDRAVLHHVLRAPSKQPADQRPVVDGQDTLSDVHQTLGAIEKSSEAIRTGQDRGASGKRLTDVVVIGIGGSYLGTEFVYEALRTEPACAQASVGRRLRFLANVDPIDVGRATEGLDAHTTLVVIVSKTFTTAETILNAKTLRGWLRQQLKQEDVSAHFAAVSTAIGAAVDFGVPAERIFPIWDWVGGRYSVTSAVGVLPLALQFGFPTVQELLRGAHSIDQHFFTTDLRDNLPVLLGLWGVWNSSLLGHAARALLPYCQALHRFPAHVQQLDMESNGKRVTRAGRELEIQAGEIDFGEPGTNGQHSFYQLLHQGRVVPADFIGFRRSQQPRKVEGEMVTNHDELMSNFFAQPDALAVGRTAEEVLAEGAGISADLIPHKVFPGNRPSNVLLLDALTPYTAGQLLALYEHRTAVQGFVWGLNSFDQWGVELGKGMAKRVRQQLADSRSSGRPAVAGHNPSTAALLDSYLRPQQ